MIDRQTFDSLVRSARERELTDQEHFEVAFAASPELRATYAEFGVTDYPSYLRKQEQQQAVLRHAGDDKFKFNGDRDGWRTEALKRSAAVEAELRSSSGHGGF